MGLFETIAYAEPQATAAANAVTGAMPQGEVNPVMQMIVTFLPIILIIL